MANNKIELHKLQAIKKIESLIDGYAHADEDKAQKFMYWLEDYVKFLDYETSFSPRLLRRYKRGEVIKAHLGYNIGSEEGGLHYCVVLDNNNALSSPVVTVVPLTSVKDNKNLKRLNKYEVFLGFDLKEKVLAKLQDLITDCQKHIECLHKTSATNIIQNLPLLTKKMALIDKIKAESDKMKSGSIALTGQITTISKIRIYDPKTNSDPLSKIKLSDENLDKIDESIKKIFLKK